MNQEHIDTIKHVGDTVAIGVAAGALVNLLPPLSALIAIIYTLLRIWETKTVQGVIAYIRGD